MDGSRVPGASRSTIPATSSSRTPTTTASRYSRHPFPRSRSTSGRASGHRHTNPTFGFSTDDPLAHFAAASRPRRRAATAPRRRPSSGSTDGAYWFRVLAVSRFGAESEVDQVGLERRHDRARRQHRLRTLGNGEHRLGRLHLQLHRRNRAIPMPPRYGSRVELRLTQNLRPARGRSAPLPGEGARPRRQLVGGGDAQVDGRRGAGQVIPTGGPKGKSGGAGACFRCSLLSSARSCSPRRHSARIRFVHQWGGAGVQRGPVLEAQFGDRRRPDGNVFVADTVQQPDPGLRAGW